jgi:serine/threonine protein kinase
MKSLLDGLSRMHDLNIAHRDLSDSTLIRTEDIVISLPDKALEISSYEDIDGYYRELEYTKVGNMAPECLIRPLLKF